MRTASILAACVLSLPTLAAAQTVFPTGTTIWDPAATNDGYTVFLGADGVCYMIDMDGSVAHTWHSTVAGKVLVAIDPLSPGHILANTRPAGANGPQLGIGELDKNNNLVWSFEVPVNAPPGTSFHHDSERLPNGNTVILALQNILVPDISPITLQDDMLVEVDPTGKVVWTWFLWQHADEFGFDEEAKQLIRAQGGDWAHANSVSVIPPNQHSDPAFTPGNLLVSLRFTNTIFIIDHQTKKIVWKLGPLDHITFGQHYPHMLEQGLVGAGNIMVFCNGSGTGYPLRTRAPGYSRLLEIDPNTKQIVWEYNSSKSGQNVRDFWSDIISGGQRLANGNTLICQGARGRLFEIDPTGKIVWEYVSPIVAAGGNRMVFRAYRVDYSWGQ